MLRRSHVALISAYEFGHPGLYTNFSREVYETPKPVAPSPVQTSTLPNGVRVVTHDRRGQMTSIGFFVEAGPKFDPATAPGLSYVMRYAALTSNLDESLFQVDRAMRSVGAAYGSTEVNKRFVGWLSEVPRQSWKTPLEKMQSCLAAPRFTESDVERFRDTFDNELEELRWNNPREYCEQMLETVAFFREPLGNPRHVLPTDNDVCSSAELLKQYCRYFAPQRVTIAGVNVDHQELIGHYNTLPFQLSHNAPHFKDALLEASPIADEAQQFSGLREGTKIESRAKEMGTLPHMDEDGTVAIGWLTNGADKNVRDYATSLVCREVLRAMTQDGIRHERNASHFGTRTFYRPYSSAGLLGVTVRGPAAGEGLANDVQAAVSMLPVGKVTKADVGRATQGAAVAVFHDQLENQREYLAYLATHKFAVDEVLKAISAVTVEDVNMAFSNMKASKPVSFGTGQVSNLPCLRKMVAQQGKQ